jgi:hypothetical protein
MLIRRTPRGRPPREPKHEICVTTRLTRWSLLRKGSRASNSSLVIPSSEGSVTKAWGSPERTVAGLQVRNDRRVCTNERLARCLRHSGPTLLGKIIGGASCEAHQASQNWPQILWYHS